MAWRRVFWITAFLLSGCGRPPAEAPVVVASIFPLADVTRQLAGGQIQVLALMPAGASPHTFDPSPDKVRMVAEAPVIVRIGGPGDGWLDGLLTSSEGEVVTAMKLTKLLPATHHHEDEDEPEHEGGEPAALEHHGPEGEDLHAFDPHVWLDPMRVRNDLAPAIAKVLQTAFPKESEGIKLRLVRFQLQMDNLDQELRQTLAGVSSRRYIATHSAWQYFDERYGLELAATVERQAGSAPSAQWLRDVVETARREKVPAIFAEQQLSRQLVDVVSQEADLRVGMLDPLGGEGVEGRDSYGALLRYNAAELARGLAP